MLFNCANTCQPFSLSLTFSSSRSISLSLLFHHSHLTRDDASLLWYSSHSVLFFYINSFIASLFFWCLPHSLPIYLSQTTTISLHLSQSLAQSPFYPPFRYYFVIASSYLPLSLSLSVSLAQPLTILLFIFATLFLSFLHSCYDMDIIIIVLFLF